MHGAGPLKWNTAFASSAAAWGLTCCKNRFLNSDSFSETPYSFESLAAGYRTIAEPVTNWYYQVKNCGPMPGCMDGNKDVVGRFTAMVWKEAAELGSGDGSPAEKVPPRLPQFGAILSWTDSKGNQLQFWGRAW